MKAQNNQSVVPSGSLLIQPGQPMTMQPGSMTNLQPNTPACLSHQGLQVWSPAPVNTMNMSSLGTPPPGHPGMVTLPSGHTVLMTNLVTTSTTPQIPLPVSSPLPKTLQTSPVGTSMILSNSAPQPLGIPMTQHLTPAMIQGPNGPISVALPNPLLTPGSINNPMSTTATFVSSSASQLASDPVQNPHIVEQNQSSLPPFPNSGFSTIIQGGQVMVDQSGIGMQPPNQTQTNVVSMPTSHSQPTILQPVMHTASQSFLSDLNSESVATSSDGTHLNAHIPPSLTNSAPDSGFPDSSNSSSGQNESSSLIVTQQQNVPSNEPATSQNVSSQISSPQVPASTIDSSSLNPINQPPNTIQITDPSADPKLTVFTPTSLNQLIADLDPQLQLDPEAYEVIINLANEFILSVASKAQKLASHRGSSSVDAKDIHFCLARDWNISIPGNLAEDRPLRQPAMVEAHKQRLALIKQQIKKM